LNISKIMTPSTTDITSEKLKPKPDAPQIVWHRASVSLDERIACQRHKAGVVWFTGLSGSGKSTVANVVDQMLWRESIRTYLLDGDNVRHGLCATPAILSKDHSESFAKRFGLGFGPEDREENIRRVGAAAGLLVGAGLIVLTAFVSPYRNDRQRVREQIEKEYGPETFLEVFVDTPLEICESRDPKGLYKQARAGKIANFTGISDPYEAPEKAEIVLAGGTESPETLASRVVAELKSRQWVN
jgi:adenylylsulfate kinase